MINYFSTLAARQLGNHVGSVYLEALVKRELEVLDADQFMIGYNSSNHLPTSPLPIYFPAEHPANTQNKELFLVDLSRVKDNESDFRRVNAIATAMWTAPEIAERFLPTRKFAARLYSTWVSKNLEAKFRFDHEDTYKIGILFAIYYYCAHSGPKQLFEDSYGKLLQDLNEITGYPVMTIKELFESNELYDFTSFSFTEVIECAQKLSNDTKAKVSVASVQSSLAHSWFGTNSPYYCTLALEFPPTWLTMVYFALVDRGYQRSGLAKLVAEYSGGRRSDKGERFAHQFHSIIKAGQK